MKLWFKAALIRAIKTIAQAAIGFIGTSVVIGEVDWMFVLSGSALAGIVSLLMSIAGLPEVKMAQEEQDKELSNGEANE
jgi:hypothetical protein